MSAEIRVKVRCFSHLRYALGKSEFELELTSESTLADVAQRVRELGGSSVDELPFRLALNQVFASDTAVLADGDEVALIPPVQGG